MEAANWQLTGVKGCVVKILVPDTNTAVCVGYIRVSGFLLHSKHTELVGLG